MEYFENDTKLAWVVNPEKQTVTVYRSSYPHKLLTNKDTLEGEGVLERMFTSTEKTKTTEKH